MNTENLIICGAGNSIQEGIDLGLFDILKNHTSVGLNYFNKHACPTTWTTFVDNKFYRYNLEYIKPLPLIIGKYDPLFLKHEVVQNNTLLLPYHNTYFGKNSWKIYDRTCLKCGKEFKEDFKINYPSKCPDCKSKDIYKWGFYCSHLCGLFALTINISLGFKNIYLLGFDCCEVNGKTHFFQDDIDLTEKVDNNSLKHYGIGKQKMQNGSALYNTSTYNDINNLNNHYYAPYKSELEKINIYNVSMESTINVFPKITYKQMFEILKGQEVDQERQRNEIRKFVEEKLKL